MTVHITRPGPPGRVLSSRQIALLHTDCSRAGNIVLVQNSVSTLTTALLSMILTVEISQMGSL